MENVSFDTINTQKIYFDQLRFWKKKLSSWPQNKYHLCYGKIADKF